MKRYVILILVLPLLLSGCFKQESPIPPNPVGPIEEEVIPMTQYYINQVYFNLNSGEQVSLNKKNVFELSFSCADTSSLIRMNTASFMQAAETTITDMTMPVDTTGLQWQFDKSDGNPDSTALINWINIQGEDTTYSDKVWIINRGINAQGFPMGLMKVKFHSLKDDTYNFSYADVKSNTTTEVKITKNPGFNYTQYKFGQDGIPEQFEPENDNWDLVFTQYTTLLYTDEGDAYPYLVTGTLINESGTLVSLDTTMVFEDITIEDVLFLEYSKNLDAVGYEWKELIGDINGGDFYYKARSNWNYIIRSNSGLYYKLRFVGFYEQETGEKGYPTFEFQRL